MSLPHSTPVICKSVQPFTLDDLDGVGWLPDGAYHTLAMILPRSTVWTGRVQGEVVAVCGLTKINDYCCEAWTYLHKEAVLHPFWLHRATMRILENDVGASEYRRVQSYADDTAQAACRWLERLGFHVESLCPLMGDRGQTLRRYVWFPGGHRG